jgi:dipeptidyl-peptidase-4
MRLAPTIAIATLAALLAGCGSGSPGPTVSPHDQKPGRFDPGVDPDIARIFGDPPLTGRLPSSLSWSPDGQQLAFIRKATAKSGKPQTELWIHDLAGHRERPLVAEPEAAVSWFGWAGSYRIAYAIDGDLHLIGVDGKKRRITETEAAEEAMQAAPDGSQIAFVRDYDVYVVDLTSGAELRLTEDGTKDRSYGLVTWVYGEEFDTEAGLGWSPDSARLWIYATDESEVTKRTVVADTSGGTRIQAYPQAGQHNPVLRIGVVDLSGDEPRTVWLKTGGDPDVYLPQVTWHPDGKRLAVARIDRLQTLIELLICAADSGACEPLITERDPRWLNLLGPPVFIGKGDDFLWLSERDGYSHIYRIGLDGKVVDQLTEGEWVVSSIAALAEEREQVYFTGNPETPITSGVYRVSLTGGRVERVTAEDGVHSPEFAPDASHFADTHTGLDAPPRTDLLTADGELLATVRESDLTDYSTKDVVNDIFPIENKDGEIFWAHLTRPLVLEPDRRYPVLVYVYGGPHAQVVRDHFRTTFQPWRNLLASRGILVFSMDNRGSAGRGRDFETPIHLRLGLTELEDQLVGAKYLRNQPYVDPDRLAIFGWSYGGTMVLNALLRTNGVFRAGIAVAPVTDWRQYDTAYTERYMQRPDDNPDGYEETSLLPLAGELDAPLLMVHGLADDNVHFANSALMIDAFVEAGKEIELMVFPGRAHGIRGAKPRALLFSKITRFLERHL